MAILILIFLAGGGGYFGLTSLSRRSTPCKRCLGEGYLPVRGGRRYRRCPRCRGTRVRLHYAAARYRARRAAGKRGTRRR